MATAPARYFDSGVLSLLPAPLREPRRAWLAIVTGWACAFFPSLLLSFAAQSLAPSLERPEFPMTGPMALFLLVVFAPFIETLIMAGGLAILTRIVPPTAAVLLSALGWGVAHSSMAPAWGLVIWWPFLVFSTLYLVWRERGFWPAVGVVAVTHGLQNLGPALLLAFGR